MNSLFKQQYIEHLIRTANEDAQASTSVVLAKKLLAALAVEKRRYSEPKELSIPNWLKITWKKTP